MWPVSRRRRLARALTVHLLALEAPVRDSVSRVQQTARNLGLYSRWKTRARAGQLCLDAVGAEERARLTTWLEYRRDLARRFLFVIRCTKRSTLSTDSTENVVVSMFLRKQGS